MDIVVTIPKTEISNTEKENKFAEKHKGNAVQFFKVSRKPTKLNVGNKVYICKNGVIDHYHKFLGFKDNMKCDVTNRVWDGVNLMLEYPPIKMENPIKAKGFRGFKYFNEDTAYEQYLAGLL